MEDVQNSCACNVCIGVNMCLNACTHFVRVYIMRVHTRVGGAYECMPSMYRAFALDVIGCLVGVRVVPMIII